MPVPLQSGQVLSRAERMAERMNAERFTIPRMARERDASVLNVMMFPLRSALGVRFPIAEWYYEVIRTVKGADDLNPRR